MTDLVLSLEEGARFLHRTPEELVQLSRERGVELVDGPEGLTIRPQLLAELADDVDPSDFAQHALTVLKRLETAAAASPVASDPPAKSPAAAATSPPAAATSPPASGAGKPAAPPAGKTAGRIAFPCPQCATQLLARVEHVGMHGVCPSCKTKFQIPRIAAARPAGASAAPTN